MKKLTGIILTFLIAFSSFTFVMPESIAYGKTLSQLQTEQKELKKKQEVAKAALATAKDNKEKMNAEIEELDSQLEIAQNDFELVQAQLEEAEAKLKEAKVELAAASEASETQLNIFSKRVKYIYENGSVGYLKVLLNSQNIGDFLTRMQYVNDIMTYDNETLDRLKKYEAIKKTKTEEITEEKASIEILVEDQKVKNAALSSKISEKEALFNKYQEDESDYKSVLESTEEASNEVQKLINAAVSAQSSSSSGSSSYKANYTGGQLQWPVPGRNYISSGYGNRPRPIGSGYEFHTGYDIPAPYGSNIVAAEAGTVITAGYVRGYGYTVIINHGNGLTTLYGHNSSLVVSMGQTVTRGQVIAKAGSTGNSTGNHCHFEVRLNGAHVSPKSYLGV
ncbi:MAG TPA: hypothetical protein DIC60_03910 [Lachnospiraceae bacterium]|nr:hypothetical protein [Lachnospiraceae bacterium]